MKRNTIGFIYSPNKNSTVNLPINKICKLLSINNLDRSKLGTIQTPNK